MSPAPEISAAQLALSVGLVLLAGLVTALMRLGLVRRLAWGTLRTFVQLTLVGYVLTYVFALDHPLAVAGLVLLMCVVAAQAAVSRLRTVPFRPYLLALLSLSASTFLVGTLVCSLVIAPRPWYAARIAIPIAGMLLGNSLNGVALALDRLFEEVRAHSAEVEQRLCLGFSCWEALLPHVRAAMRAGLTPIVNALMVVGVVSLPGMMSGQILAGADPLQAVRYQIVVMLMIAASTSLGCLLLVGLSFRRCFTADGALEPELLQRR